MKKLLGYHFLKSFIAFSILGIGLIIWGFPLLWLFISSLRPSHLIYSNKLVIFFKPVLNNYIQIFTNRSFLHQLFNSLLVSVCTGLLSVSFGTMAAYGLTRFKIYMGEKIVFLILVSRMVPPVILTIPLFIIFLRLKIINTPLSLIIVNTAFNLSLAILIMLGFLEDIPEELEEAALIDGASRVQAFFKIVLPIVQPGLAVTTMLVFIFTWNEFMFASIFAFSPRAKTLTVGTADFVTSYATLWGPMFASGVMVVTPAVLLVFLMRRYLVSGLTFGALKQ